MLVGLWRRCVAPAAAIVVVLALAACSDDAPPDGYTSVATGDTYGEWELFVEHEDGEWTGCLRLEHFGGGERCDDPDADLVRFESDDGAAFGAVAEGRTLVFADDGREVELIDGRFYVVASDAEVRLEP